MKPCNQTTFPVASIIIPNWNGFKNLSQCLESLRIQSFKDFEVIVVDNGSSDGSAHFIRDNFPNVKLISLDKNYGFAKPVNIGIQFAFKNQCVKYICMVNNDVWCEKDWLRNLVATLDSDETIGFAASKILCYKQRTIINAVGDIVLKNGFATHRGYLEQDNGQYNTRAWVFGACAAAAIYRRTMLEDIGLLDEDFFAYCEDVDLSFRAQLRGYRCLYVPDAVAYHKEWSSSKYYADYYSLRNTLEVILKNLPGPLLIRHLPHIFIAQMACLYKKRLIIPTIMRAWCNIFINLGKIMKKRKRIQALRKVDDAYIRSLLSQ